MLDVEIIMGMEENKNNRKECKKIKSFEQLILLLMAPLTLAKVRVWS